MIISVINRRGGAGKTTTAHALGAGLAKKGFKVLFIDLDSQGNLSFDNGILTARSSSMDLLTGRTGAKEAIITGGLCDIIPGNNSLSTADIILTDTGKEYRLKEALETIRSAYDHIIIDTPPALGTLAVNALTASDAAIIPAQAEIHSLQGIKLLNETIEAVKKYTNSNLRIDGILLTRYNPRTVLSKDMKKSIESMAGALNTRLYKSAIRECVSIKEAQARQQDIFNYAPQSNASRDYMAFINEFLKV